MELRRARALVYLLTETHMPMVFIPDTVRADPTIPVLTKSWYVLDVKGKYEHVATVHMPSTAIIYIVPIAACTLHMKYFFRSSVI